MKARRASWLQAGQPEAALDGLLDDPSAFVGNASTQVAAVVQRVADVVATHPQAAAYDPEPIL